MEAKSTTMDFGMNFETGNLGLPETFFSVEDMLDFSNEEIAGPIGEGASLVSGEIVSNYGTSHTAGELHSKFSDIDLQRAGELKADHSGSVQGIEKMKEQSFDSDRDIITHEFPAIDPLSVPYDDWFSNLLEGPFSPGGKSGYGEDIFGMHMQPIAESSMTCNQSSITSDQKSYNSNDKSITSSTQRSITRGDEHSCRDPFLSSSPVSVLESTSVSSGNTRGDGSCAINVEHTNINHGDDHLHMHHNLLYKEQSVPGRARSKRLRTGGRLWGNARILADASGSSFSSTNPTSATDAETTFSSDSSLISGPQGIAGGGGGGGGKVNVKRDCHNSTYSVPPADNMQNISSDMPDILHLMTPPPKAVTTAKKPWKPGKNTTSSSSKDGAAGASSPETSNHHQQQPWRCLHCGSQKTPQWRAGPQGPKTLCNACGVRFKSGRLVPEYRPAGSPGYDGDRFSNCHKKIMERRRKSDTLPPPLKTSTKHEPVSYPLGPGLSSVEFQSIPAFASSNPFSSSPVRGLDVDRTSCS